jgi:hypothetical protein
VVLFPGQRAKVIIGKSLSYQSTGGARRVADEPAKNVQLNSLLQINLNTMQIVAASSFYATQAPAGSLVPHNSHQLRQVDSTDQPDDGTHLNANQQPL